MLKKVYADRERWFQLAMLSLESYPIHISLDTGNVNVSNEQISIVMYKIEMRSHNGSISDVIRWTRWGAGHRLICLDIVEKVNKSLIVYSLLLYWNEMYFMEWRWTSHRRNIKEAHFCSESRNLLEYVLRSTSTFEMLSHNHVCPLHMKSLAVRLWVWTFFFKKH